MLYRVEDLMYKGLRLFDMMLFGDSVKGYA